MKWCPFCASLKDDFSPCIDFTMRIPLFKSHYRYVYIYIYVFIYTYTHIQSICGNKIGTNQAQLQIARLWPPCCFCAFKWTHGKTWTPDAFRTWQVLQTVLAQHWEIPFTENLVLLLSILSGSGSNGHLYYQPRIALGNLIPADTLAARLMAVNRRS